jgi:hypothetical protein
MTWTTAGWRESDWLDYPCTNTPTSARTLMLIRTQWYEGWEDSLWIDRSDMCMCIIARSVWWGVNDLDYRRLERV